MSLILFGMQFESDLKSFIIRLKLADVQKKFVEIRSRSNLRQLAMCSCCVCNESIFDP